MLIKTNKYVNKGMEGVHIWFGSLNLKERFRTHIWAVILEEILVLQQFAILPITDCALDKYLTYRSSKVQGAIVKSAL
jgi:hypothetical protein